MKKEENGRGFSRKGGLCLLIAWTMLLAGATVCSLVYERKSMPEVSTGYLESGEVTYSCQMEAEVMDETEAEMLIPRSMHLPSRMFGEGTELEIGTVISAEKGETDFLVKIRLKESGTVGERLSVTLSDTTEYEQVIDPAYIRRDDYGQLSVFEVTESDGPWGKEYRLNETAIVCFPDDISVNPSAVYSELESPIVLESSGELESGMRVILKK